MKIRNILILMCALTISMKLPQLTRVNKKTIRKLVGDNPLPTTESKSCDKLTTPPTGI